MADEGVLFSTPTAKRVIDATRWAERRRGHTGKGARQLPKRQASNRFHARLLAEEDGAYSWKMVHPAPDGGWIDDPAVTSGGAYNATAANGTTGLPTGSTTGTVVELAFAGFDGDDAPLYQFADSPLPTPTEKYQVLTAVGDPPNCVWVADHMRFSGE